MKRISLTIAMFGMLITSLSVHSIDTTKFIVKLKTVDKFQRSLVADTGAAVVSSSDEDITVIATLQEYRELTKIGNILGVKPMPDGMAMSHTQDFPSQDAEYHNYAQLLVDIDNIQKQYPNLVKVFSIGKSVQGRDLMAMHISGNLESADKLPGVIYFGGHHARAHLSVETPLRIFKNLLQRYASGEERIVRLLNSRDIYVIPAVNPDGLEHDVSTGKYLFWRKNRSQNANGTYGVDLNRNYGYRWGTGGSSKDPNSDTYMGTAPFSEPETQAVRNFIDAHNNLTTLISFHTFSKLILYPWGGSYSPVEAKDEAVFKTMAGKMADMNGYVPEQASDLYIASGDTTDWAYGTHKIFAFTFELDPKNDFMTGMNGFYPGAKIIPEVVQKNTEPVLYTLEYADNPYRVLSPTITSF